ncbi:MAG: hypothetical protein H7A33_06575 [Deltaproteobacteria bacterium]|nr:hypothetical protein [Deltaproteobacteria bacterium]
MRFQFAASSLCLKWSSLKFTPEQKALSNRCQQPVDKYLQSCASSKYQSAKLLNTATLLQGGNAVLDDRVWSMANQFGTFSGNALAKPVTNFN